MSNGSEGQPKPAFYIATAVVVLVLIVLAVRNFNTIAPKGEGGGGDIQGKGGGDLIKKTDLIPVAENPDAKIELTAKSYSFVPADRLPPVKGTSAYRALGDPATVRFAINVWAGWAPIILANEGLRAGKTWTGADGKPFQLELVLIDNPVAMRDAYAAGEVQIGWGTLDMVPLFMEGFVDTTGSPRDSRVMPRIYQQIDWSNGGDGIVAREAVKTVADLRGRTVVLAQNSPSHYFLLNMLVMAGVQPAEVNMKFTNDAFEAASAFNADKSIAAAVSWAPDIYKLKDVPGNKMLVTTLEANKLIADVWFARADFAKDHPAVLEGLVRGIFDAMEELKSDAGKAKAGKLMAAGYGIPEADAVGMLADAHNTNWAENAQFFLNPNNPTNFERVWNNAYMVYRAIRSVTHQPVPFDQVMDFSLIEKLGREDKYKAQKDEYQVKLTPMSPGDLSVAEREILTNTIQIQFYPNNADPNHKVKRPDGREELYDPKVDQVIRQATQLAGQFSGSRILIEGHCDSSMRDQGVPPLIVRELSEKRAQAVKDAILTHETGKTLDPNRFTAKGWGWDRPVVPVPVNGTPEEVARAHARNRRVEIKVFTAEKG